MAMVASISVTQTAFYSQAIIDRESVIIHDMVTASVIGQEQDKQIRPIDFEHYQSDIAQERFRDTLSTLMNLSGVGLIKLFDKDKTIVWSSEPDLLGTSQTSHPADIDRALKGEVRAVFVEGERAIQTAFVLPSMPLIEFYVPLTLSKAEGSAKPLVIGVLALYRSPQELNTTIQNGLQLLWLATGGSGIVLFAALYSLFRTVYYRQRQAESQFAKLSTEHERLIQIEKLSAMGQMLSEIAHQLNSPLVGVVNLTQIAEREVDRPDRVRQLLGEIRKAGNHCHEFVQRMLRFNQIARFRPQRVEMKPVLRETIDFFMQSIGGDSRVMAEVPAEDVVLEADPVLIRHALFNLIHNAALARPNGQVTVSLTVAQQNGVDGYNLSVTDLGSGISPEVAGKLFTPFFTTRPGGTGLGLSVAQHIAAQHGGNIRAENIPEGGARFILWLPLGAKL